MSVCWCVSVCVTRNLRRRKQTRQAVVEVHGDVMARKRRKMEKEVGGGVEGLVFAEKPWNGIAESVLFSIPFGPSSAFTRFDASPGPDEKKRNHHPTF